MQSHPLLSIPQFLLRELFVCFGRLNRISGEIGQSEIRVQIGLWPNLLKLSVNSGYIDFFLPLLITCYNVFDYLLYNIYVYNLDALVCKLVNDLL